VILSGLVCLLATLDSAAQAFGVAMVNLDSHVVNARAALLGLFGFLALAWALFGIAVRIQDVARTPRSQRAASYLLLVVIALGVASLMGVAEHAGLFLFS
jgi:hypothetical protein